MPTLTVVNDADNPVQPAAQLFTRAAAGLGLRSALFGFVHYRPLQWCRRIRAGDVRKIVRVYGVWSQPFGAA